MEGKNAKEKINILDKNKKYLTRQLSQSISECQLHSPRKKKEMPDIYKTIRKHHTIR